MPAAKEIKDFRIVIPQRVESEQLNSSTPDGAHFSVPNPESGTSAFPWRYSLLPPFHEYHFIDSDTGRAAELRKESGNRPDVFTYSEDCNTVLLSKVFPRADYGQYKRALCLLDPTTLISLGK